MNQWIIYPHKSSDRPNLKIVEPIKINAHCKNNATPGYVFTSEIEKLELDDNFSLCGLFRIYCAKEYVVKLSGF